MQILVLFICSILILRAAADPHYFSKKYAVQPRQSFGTMPADLQEPWIWLQCDRILDLTTANVLTVLNIAPTANFLPCYSVAHTLH